MAQSWQNTPFIVSVPAGSIAPIILPELLVEGAGPVQGFGGGHRAGQQLLPAGSI
jgi:hypothetical protein